MVADEPQSASGRASRSDTSRLEALSDGVIAVAITLLVLDLKVPHVEDESLWNALVTQWPSYFAYITSFLVIGILVYLVLLVVSFVSPIPALTGTFLVALYYSFEHLPKARATEA